VKLCEVIAKIEKRIPTSWAEEWDNPGLSVGDPYSCVSRAAIALDATCDTILKAASEGCQLLVTHHPAIFNALRSIVLDKPAPRAIACALQNGVALYAAHTNWDSSFEGVNFRLAEALGLGDIAPLLPPSSSNGSWGMGSVGFFAETVTAPDCLRLVKERWGLSSCRFYGDVRNVRKAAIGGGSCGSMWYDAFRIGADVFITADISYHQRQEALGMGLGIIAADHGEMERVSLPALAALVSEETGLPACLVREDSAACMIV